MNKWNPSNKRCALFPKLGDRDMKCFSSTRRVRICATSVSGRHGISREDLIKAIHNLRSVRIVHGPTTLADDQSRYSQSDRRTHHIVATTPRNPANSIVPAKCIASSGTFSSPFAVSHAQRNTNEAFGMGIFMILETGSGPSSRMSALSSGFVLSCIPWHAK